MKNIYRKRATQEGKLAWLFVLLTDLVQMKFHLYNEDTERHCYLNFFEGNN